MRRFTLIELLVVIAIIAILASLLLPSLNNAKDQGRLSTCTNNLRTMTMANTMYIDDFNGFAIHGIDMAYAWPASITGFGRCFFPTNILDDDWGDAKPGTPGRNPASNGEQNICHIGQLIMAGYVSKIGDGLACPQADYPFPTAYATGMRDFKFAKSCIKSAWEGEYWTGGPSYTYTSTTYQVRGPLFKESKITKPSTYGLFCDHEQAVQGIIAGIPTNNSPRPFWPYVHKIGPNVAYLDGHVTNFSDPDRKITYWCDQTRWYGNGWALYGGGYDR